MNSKFLTLIKALYGSTKGSFNYLTGISSDLKAYFFGEQEIFDLRVKLGSQAIEYKNLRKSYKNKYPYIDSAIISGLTLPEMLKKGVSEEVQLAYQLAYPDKSANVSFTDAWDGFISHEERIGFVNGIKGKLFEIKYVDHLNQTLEPGYSATIATKSNQPGWDIQITGPDQEIINQIQLKASSSIEYVKAHFEKYPDIDVVTLDDLKGQIGLNDKITATAISNEELQAEVMGATSTNYEYLPGILALSYVIFSSYTKTDLSWYEKNIELGKRGTGMAIDITILTSLGLVGIIPILIKKSVLNVGNKKKEYIKILKKQIKNQKESIKFWEKNLSRRDFLKGLALTASASRFAIKKI